VRGTLGIVLAARRKGRIPAARPVLLRLREAGMYLSDSILERSLARVGE
jgi:predicted nucleic acid-binding protein